MAQRAFPAAMDGGCICGHVRYRVTGAPLFIMACHCTDCQQQTASAFSLAMIVEDAQFTVTSGQPREWAKRGSSGKVSHEHTCPVCGGWTHTRPENQPGKTAVRPSTLDDHRWVVPVGQIYTRSALPWAKLAVQFSYEEEFDDPEPMVEAFAIGGGRS